MEIFLSIPAILLSLAGVAGCIIPMLPGPPLGWLAMLAARFLPGCDFSGTALALWGAITLAVTLLDYWLPVELTRRLGGSRSGVAGATVGVIAGLFILPPLGLIVCPFLGALLGELLNDRRDSATAFRVAMGSLAAFVAGTGVKLIVCGAMCWHVARALW